LTKSNNSPVKKRTSRSEVNPADAWNLSSLYPSDDAWEKAFAGLQKQVGG
jgi:oligoendopeptidase F